MQKNSNHISLNYTLIIYTDAMANSSEKQVGQNTASKISRRTLRGAYAKFGAFVHPVTILAKIAV